MSSESLPCKGKLRLCVYFLNILYTMLFSLYFLGCSSPSDLPKETPSSQDASEHTSPDQKEPIPEPQKEKTLVPEKQPPEPAPPCEWDIPKKYTLSEGSRLFIPTQLQTSGGKVLLQKIPKGWQSIVETEKKRIAIRPAYGSKGDYNIPLTLACARSSSKHTLQIKVNSLTWKPGVTWSFNTTGPSAREHPKIWISPKYPDTLWLWGGLLYYPRQFTPDYKLWKMDLKTNTWTSVKQGNDAPKLTTGQVAVHTDGQSILHYGGSQNNRQTSPALYQLSFDTAQPTWKKLEKASWDYNSITLGAFFYDKANKRFISACGFQQKSSYDIHCKVSAYYPDDKGGQWKKLNPRGAPPSGRYGFFYTYDEVNQRLILFSGAQKPVSQQDMVNPAQDTWALNLKGDIPEWERLRPYGTHPRGRRNGCSAYDPIGHRLFVFGGTPDARTTVPGFSVLHLDKGYEKWYQVDTQNLPPVRSSCVGIYDAKRKQILFGFGNSSKANYADWQRLQL